MSHRCTLMSDTLTGHTPAQTGGLRGELMADEGLEPANIQVLTSALDRSQTYLQTQDVGRVGKAPRM